MALSNDQYVASGATDTFNVTFTYLDQAHVRVYVDGVEDVSFTWPTASSVQLSSTPTAGQLVLIERSTSPEAILVDWIDGSVLVANDLDVDSLQVFYLAQEANDKADAAMNIDNSLQWDGRAKQIKDIADGTDPQDVVTLSQLLTWTSGGFPIPASYVGVTPAGDISNVTLDLVLNELDTEKLPKAGGTMTGTLVFTDLSDGTITIGGWVDEDTMVSDSATLVPTQQSVKAYVDSHTSLTAAHGATGAVVGTTNTQTLTNKTISAGILSGTTTISGLMDSSSYFLSTRAAAANTAFEGKVTGDANTRIRIGADGLMDWGDGTATWDTNLYRSAANVLRTDDSFSVGGSITVAGTVDGRDVSLDGSVLDFHTADTAAHGATGAVVGTTNTQTLTNKTISADSNTLSGIAASSFVLSNASGNIDGAAVQKAIPAGVVVGTTDAQTLTNKTIVAASNTITTAASGNLTSTNLNAALAELQTDIDTRATSSALTTHTAATAAHGATGAVVGTTNTQTLTNKTLTTPTITLKQSTAPTPTAEGDIQWDTDDNKIKIGDGVGTKTFSPDDVTSGIHGITGSFVGTTDSQTLTNKTISVDNNTVSGIAASSFVLSNGSGNIDGAAAQKAIPAGVVVGTTDAQTLTNKTLTSPTVNTPTISAPTISGAATFSGTIEATGTSHFNLPAGTTAQRPGTPTTGDIRFNSTTGEFEGYKAGAWGTLGGGGAGLGTLNIIRTNPTTIDENITFPSNTNGVVVGPITVSTSYTLDVSASGARLVVL